MSISTSNLLFFLSQTSDLLSFFQKYEDELIKETPAAAFTPCWISTGCVREIYLRAPAPATTFTVYSTMNALRGGIPWWPSASPLALRYRNARRCCASAATPWLDPRFHRDGALIFALERGIGLSRCNDLLFDIKEDTL